MKLLKKAFWLFVPAALAAELLHAPSTVIFVCSCLALLPLAGAIGHATEQLAHRMGPAAGPRTHPNRHAPEPETG